MKSKKKIRKKFVKGKKRTQKGGMKVIQDLFSGIRSKIISIANSIVPLN